MGARILERMSVLSGLSLAAGLYGAYRSHEVQERTLEALDDQTGVLKEQLRLTRQRTDAADGDNPKNGKDSSPDPRRGSRVDETA